jgi:hypothetical protein
MDRPIGIINRPLWRSAPALETASSVRWQTWIGLLVALFLLALVGWLHLEQKATITAARAEIRALEQRQIELERETRELQALLATQGAIEPMMRRAEALGLRPPERIVTLSVSPLPAAATAPASQTQPAAAPPALAWMSRVQDWLRGSP